jgi:hypothetical protein
MTHTFLGLITLALTPWSTEKNEFPFIHGKNLFDRPSAKRKYFPVFNKNCALFDRLNLLEKMTKRIIRFRIMQVLLGKSRSQSAMDENDAIYRRLGARLEFLYEDADDPWDHHRRTHGHQHDCHRIH